MATIFNRLLSKTLLTFLYKYLSDVDVEGIEMPSLYGSSSEGSGSGWGVRLSNVKLREGAELMTLPGSVVKQKQKQKKSKAATSDNKTNNNNNSSSSDTMTMDDAAQGATNSDSEKGRTKTSSEKNGFHSSTMTSNTNNKNGNTSTVTNNNHGAGRQRLDSECSTIEHEDDDDDLGSLPENDLVVRPETPTQDSSLSFLSCFAPGNEDPNEKQVVASSAVHHHHHRHQQQQQQQLQQEEKEKQSNNSSKNVSNSNENQLLEENASRDHHYLKKKFQTRSDDSNIQTTNHEDEKNYENVVPIHAAAAHAAAQGPEYSGRIEKQGRLRNTATSSKENVSENNNDETDDSRPMILRIGEGGYIGTLDVRLVGRELHVLIEDAFLTLEVVRKISDNETVDEADTSKSNTDEGATDATATVDPAEKKPTPPVAAPIDTNELKTTGERVLASSAIARFFNSLPCLFLRDILVRLVVFDDTKEANASTANTDNDNEQKEGASTDEQDIDNAELVVDVGIGLLSVTEGDDFLSPFNNGDDNSSHGEESRPPILKAQTSQIGSPSQNIYLERRIRTGKGRDGGIWLNVVTPKSDESYSHHHRLDEQPFLPDMSGSIRWARQRWLESTRYCVLRTSGLDVQARIFFGTKTELSEATSSSWYTDDPETYEGIDHTLYGFDHVVPVPTPSQLPPLPTPKTSRNLDESDEFGSLRTQVYKTDRNGIQSCKIESNFYRVARGMTPTRCTVEHLPCENCEKCWEAACTRTAEPVDSLHPLDLVTPMPGLALSVSLLDPLEVNLDRTSCEGLGLLIGLFKKPAVDNPEPPAEETEPETPPNSTEENPEKAIAVQPQVKQGYFSSFFFGSSKAEESPKKGEKLPPAFPTYMAPENIRILGVSVAELRFRVHVMRPDDNERQRTGFSFCYWDAKVECMTIDEQRLTCSEKLFEDVRLDGAILEMNEFKGTERKVLISAGVPYPEGETPPVFKTYDYTSRPPWPTTACALLDVPPTHESMHYESRERHGMQLRVLQVTGNLGKASEKVRTLYNVQLGVAEINLPWPLMAEFTGVNDEVKRSLLKIDPAEQAEAEDTPDIVPDVAKQYRVQLGGGRVRLGTMLDMRVPLTRLAGDICPDSGVSMETLLEHAEVTYGRSSSKLLLTANSAQGFSLKRLISLPEHIRLRILLFVEELEPLEKALGLKRQANSFLRCNAVNKGLGKVAEKKLRKKATSLSEGLSKKASRRQELLNKLLTLDDSALEQLWNSHQKKQKKHKKATVAKKGDKAGEP